MSVPAAAFASGSGTNLQALMDAEEGGAAYRIRLLVTDRACGAEERARTRGVAVRRIGFRERSSTEVAAEVGGALQEAGIQIAFLAGFLRLIPVQVVQDLTRRILNVHPALLPAFGGQGMYGVRVHQAVLASGASVSGPTVHYVDERYDEGTILAQWPVPVVPGDTPESLAARVLAAEHRLYPAAADALARAVTSGGRPSYRWPGGNADDSAGWQSLTTAFEILP